MKTKSLHIIKKKEKKTGINTILNNLNKVNNNAFRMRLDDDNIIETSSETNDMMFGAGFSEYDYEEW